jgi:hypothetical protein
MVAQSRPNYSSCYFASVLALVATPVTSPIITAEPTAGQQKDAMQRRTGDT